MIRKHYATRMRFPSDRTHSKFCIRSSKQGMSKTRLSVFRANLPGNSKLFVLSKYRITLFAASINRAFGLATVGIGACDPLNVSCSVAGARVFAQFVINTQKSCQAPFMRRVPPLVDMLQECISQLGVSARQDEIVHVMAQEQYATLSVFISVQTMINRNPLERVLGQFTRLRAC